MAGICCCIGVRPRVDRSDYVDINSAEMGDMRGGNVATGGKVAPGPAKLDEAAFNSTQVKFTVGASLAAGGGIEMIVAGATLTGTTLAIGLIGGVVGIVVGGLLMVKAVGENHCSMKGIWCC